MFRLQLSYEHTKYAEGGDVLICISRRTHWQRFDRQIGVNHFKSVCRGRNLKFFLCNLYNFDKTLQMVSLY